MRFSTRAIHAGDELENRTGTVVVPFYQVSTFKQSQPDTGAGYVYSRCANPTRTALESCLASLEEADHAEELLKHLKVFTPAESLGGVESLIEHPSSRTHGSVPREERDRIGVTDSLIRVSVGIEDAEDLIADLSTALEHV